MNVSIYRAAPVDGVAWVTGASSGIGRALALRLASRGYRVAVTARRHEALRALEVAGEGRITAFPGDVTDQAAMATLVAAIEAALGPIALAVLNAGFYDDREKGPFDAAIAWRTVYINLGGTIFCLDPLLPRMSGRHHGQIAIVASLAGYGGLPGSAGYGASKAGLINLAEALRLTYPEITTQIVNPGFVATAMTAGHDYDMPWMVDADRAAALIEIGLRRAGFEITFPRRLAYLTKAAGLLPYWLWLPLMARITRRVHQGVAIKGD